MIGCESFPDKYFTEVKDWMLNGKVFEDMGGEVSRSRPFSVVTGFTVYIV